MPSFVTHLESAIDGTHLPARTLQTMHEGRPLWVRYDLDRVGDAVSRDQMRSRPPSMWRYRELLPYEDDNVVSLGETTTPLVSCPRLANDLGLGELFVKDESRLPTGSFKARGMAMAVTMARELGVRHLSVPTAGNAGGALAAYAARAGLGCTILMPSDTPVVNRYEAALFGADVSTLDGLINDCGRVLKERAGDDWFDMSTLKEPYRIEGKKTMGLELADQLDWILPDVIMYPTGGGTGLIGMWKAFDELAQLGWLDDNRRPRMYACQSSGCAPIVNAFDAGERFATAPEDPHTCASGLRVPVAVGDFMILDAVRASGGRAVAADESTLIDWMNRSCAAEGLGICPETAACFDVLAQEIAAERITRDERVVVFNTGAAQKYVEAITRELPLVEAQA